MTTKIIIYEDIDKVKTISKAVGIIISSPFSPIAILTNGSNLNCLYQSNTPIKVWVLTPVTELTTTIRLKATKPTYIKTFHNENGLQAKYKTIIHVAVAEITIIVLISVTLNPIFSATK